MKSFLKGIAVAVTAYYLTNIITSIQSIVMLGLVAMTSFMILDTYAPYVATDARIGTGFGVGHGLVGGFATNKNTEGSVISDYVKKLTNAIATKNIFNISLIIYDIENNIPVNVADTIIKSAISKVKVKHITYIIDDIRSKKSNLDDIIKTNGVSCYGAKDKYDICSTCRDVVNAYKTKYWDYNKSNFKQCKSMNRPIW